MPDQGLEFEQSVGPKELPKLLPAPVRLQTAESMDMEVAGGGVDSQQLVEASDSATLPGKSTVHPVIHSKTGAELTTITVVTSHGERVRTSYLKC